MKTNTLRGRNSMAKEKFTKADYKKVSFDEMREFIESYHPEDKAWFKKVAFSKNDDTPNTDKKGNLKYNHLNAKRKFYIRYFKDELPVAEQKKEPVNVFEKLKDW